MKRIFSILTSERHLKTLQDKENATYIGASIDELVRHHPSLKTPVFEAIQETLQRIEDLGQTFAIPPAEVTSYNLLIVPDADAKVPDDHPMESAEPSPPVVQEGSSQQPNPPDQSITPEAVPNAPVPIEHDAAPTLPSEESDSQTSDGSKNLIVAYIHIMGRVSGAILFFGIRYD